ncbi:MAG: aminoacyl-tRNA hydrolase [Phycisphaeraceae bacterium]|nr:aminoacyl-tRNA hydrolase [Phycisphaeraceae bacterium]
MPRPVFRIPPDELDFRASRSGGPGGQHVNTSSTRVELRWNVRATRVLDDAERARVLDLLHGRIDDDGWLRIVASDSRSQFHNRVAAEARMTALVDQARRPPRVRHATRVPRAEKLRRLATKRKRGDTKRQRRRPSPDE